MTKRLVVSFLVLAIVAAFAPTVVQAQSYRDTPEYRRYRHNQTVRDFSPGGLYTQPGWYYNQYPGYDSRDGYRDYGRGSTLERVLVPLAAGAGGFFLGKHQGINQTRREQAQVPQQIPINQQQQQEMQRERQEPQEPEERPFMRNSDGFTRGISFVNKTQCVVTLFNRRLNQEQDIRPGGKTDLLPWYYKDVRALAFIEGQLVELDLEFQGTRVVITTPSGT